MCQLSPKNIRAMPDAPAKTADVIITMGEPNSHHVDGGCAWGGLTPPPSCSGIGGEELWRQVSTPPRGDPTTGPIPPPPPPPPQARAITMGYAPDIMTVASTRIPQQKPTEYMIIYIRPYKLAPNPYSMQKYTRHSETKTREYFVRLAR